MTRKRIAPAKLNLGLRVLRRRSDGYHDIESVMIAIGWYDEVSFVPSDSFRFTTSDATIPADGRNLCVQAATALADAAGIQAHGHLHLLKRLPHGAGLGGGSSNAAATLLLLRDTWGVALSDSVLQSIAAAIGSDVSFFLCDGPALVEGRGELVTRLGALPELSQNPLTVVMPEVRSATNAAYSMITPDDSRGDLLTVIRSSDPARWQDELINDFEAPITDLYPEIRDELAALRRAGALYAAMTGSGAAVFGFFKTVAEAEQHASSARVRGLDAWSGYALGAD